MNFNIKGLWNYDRMKVAKDDLESELLMAKKTATELTKENSYLKDKLLARDSEIKSLIIENEAMKKACKVKWRYINEDSFTGWIPVEGTLPQILSKCPLPVLVYGKEKQAPES